jgi:phosphoadenosine phosphosulfate reductase
MTVMNTSSLPLYNRILENADPKEILVWVWDYFKSRIAVTSSFQTQSIPLLNFVSLVTPQMPVYFIDTGYHFPETFAFRDQIAEDFNLNLKIVKPELERTEFESQFGLAYQSDPDECCFVNKVMPLQIVLENEMDAWVNGIRRDQTLHRKYYQVLNKHIVHPVKVICPLINWTQQDIDTYIVENDLPKHPLWAAGFTSIGCMPCTRAIVLGEDIRSGRWPGAGKTECGLHTIKAES